MRNLRAALLVPLFAAALLAQDKPEPDTPAQAADKALAAFKAGGDLKTLAEKDTPDPWLVADELCFRGEHEAAEAFAGLTSGPRHAKLAGYVARQAEEPTHGTSRAALEKANAASEKKLWGEALDLLESAGPTDANTVLTIRITHARGLTLRGLRRLRESAAALSAAGERAEEIGWLARAFVALHDAGVSAYYHSDLRGAVRCWERSAGIRERLGDRKGLARTLSNLATAYKGLGAYAKSLEYYQRCMQIQEETQDRAGIASTLGNMGGTHRLMGDYEKAQECYRQALETHEDMGNKAGISLVLHNLAVLLSKRGKNREALAHYERALALAEERGDQRRVAQTLGNIGQTYRNLGDNRKALECCERALLIEESLGDRAAVASTLSTIGTIHLAADALDQALPYLERALAQAESLGAKSMASAVLTNLGNLHKKRHDYRKALAYHERSLSIAQELGSPDAISRGLLNLTMVHGFFGEYERALGACERALEIYERLGQPQHVTVALTCAGNLHQSLGDYARALACYRRSLALSESRSDTKESATALLNMGNVYHRRGEYTRALELYARSMRVKEQRGDREGVAILLNNRGIILKALGDYASALDHFERVREIAEALEDRVLLATAFQGMGNFHDSIGDLQTALAFHERAQRLHVELGDRPSVVQSLSNIGGIYFSLGDAERALEYHESSQRLAEELKDRVGVARSLHNIGVIHKTRGDLDKALACYERSLAIERELGNLEGIASRLHNLGSLHRTAGEPALALECYGQSLEIAERIGELAIQVHDLRGMARVHLELGETGRALAAVRSGVERMSRLVAGLSEEQGSRARGEWAGVYATGCRAAVRARSPADLCYFLESGRAGTLLEGLGGRRVFEETSLPADLAEAERDARAAVAVAAREHRRALKKGVRENVKQRRTALDEARERYVQTVQRIQRQAKAAADLLYPTADGLGEIEARLRPGETLVLYGLLSEQAQALVVTGKSARIVELEKTSEIETACTALAAQDSTSDPADGIRSLRRLLVEPLGLGRKATRLLISPHGALASVPFALLVPDREVVMVPSGTTYGVLLDDREKRGEKVLALGDPDYGVKPERRALAVMRSGAKLTLLPGTRKEVEALGDVVLIRDRATESGLARALGEQRWRAVHFACHGLIRPDQPQLSSLAVTADEHNDGFLTVLEVFRMKIPADLVVLSACETARGKVYEAEGVIGFTRAFMMAGAPRVIVSLWKVDDEATRALMVKFYELWNPKDRSKGLPTATALKRAQEFVASHEKWKHPYYWAAWQLWGLPD